MTGNDDEAAVRRLLQAQMAYDAAWKEYAEARSYGSTRALLQERARMLSRAGEDLRRASAPLLRG